MRLHGGNAPGVIFEPAFWRVLLQMAVLDVMVTPMTDGFRARALV